MSVQSQPGQGQQSHTLSRAICQQPRSCIQRDELGEFSFLHGRRIPLPEGLDMMLKSISQSTQCERFQFQDVLLLTSMPKMSRKEWQGLSECAEHAEQAWI